MNTNAGIFPTQPDFTLRLSLFGVFTLATSSGVGITVSNRRARALLAMLCLVPGETLERDFVSKLLWPGRFQPQARASLRQCLLIIDKSLGPMARGVLDVSHTRIAINVGRVQTDLGHLMAALAESRISDACAALDDIGNKPLFDQIEIGAPFRGLAECSTPPCREPAANCDRCRIGRTRAERRLSRRATAPRRLACMRQVTAAAARA